METIYGFECRMTKCHVSWSGLFLLACLIRYGMGRKGNDMPMVGLLSISQESWD